MLALQTCLSLRGSSQFLAGNVCLQAFSKLGGNRLGRINLHKVSPTNLVTTIKDLQRQASLLLCHPKRTSNYMKLELENIALPSLTYRDDMTEEDKHKVLSCLQNATHGSKLELSWNEDDTEALRVLQDRFGIDQGPRVTFVFDTPCPELGVLAYSNVARGVEQAIVLGVYADFSFLEYLQELETLYIGGFGYATATIKTWHFARNLTLKYLGLVRTKLEAPSFYLKHLEVLRVLDTQIRPDMFKGCTKLMRIELREYAQEEVDEFRMALQHITIVSQ